MERNEIISRIAEAMVDPWNPITDYRDLEPVTVKYAGEILSDMRKDEMSAELEPDERLPEETTPEMVQEVMNCIIRWSKHQYRVERLAGWLKENENVCFYDQFRRAEDREVIPVDFLYNTDTFPFAIPENYKPDVAMLISIGQQSPEFSSDHEYCWFDAERWQLFSSNTPYADGIINADDFADYIISTASPEMIEELSCQMDKEEFNEIFPDQKGVG